MELCLPYLALALSERKRKLFFFSSFYFLIFFNARCAIERIAIEYIIIIKCVFQGMFTFAGNHHSTEKRSQILCVCLNYLNAPDYANKRKGIYPISCVLWKINRILSKRMNRFLVEYHIIFFSLGIDITGSAHEHTIDESDCLLSKKSNVNTFSRFKYIQI